MTDPKARVSDVFKERLRLARTRNKWTQKQVEEWSGLPSGKLAQFESGTTAPSFGNLKKLCDGLRVSCDWLIGIEDE